MKFNFRIFSIHLIIFSFLLSSLSYIPASSHDYAKNLLPQVKEPDYWPTSLWKTSSLEAQSMKLKA